MSSGAVFTMRLKDVLLSTGGNWDSSTGISVITGGDLGLAQYPIFTDGVANVPSYRATLNGKIFDHFMNREIGSESLGVWRLSMRRKMNEIMPFYNQYYLSTQIHIEPIRTTDLSTNSTMHDATVAAQTANNAANSTGTAVARTVSSDTPQTMLSGNEDYASSATDSNSQNASTATGNQASNGTTTNDAANTSTIIGYQGAASDLLIRYRDSFINVDMMVINELEECFMQIWDNGDSFTSNTNYDGFLLW